MDSPKSELDALLINSHYISRSKYPPLSLINLAAFAEQNKFNVEICDAAVLKLTEKEILAVIKEKKPKCIGLTFVTCQYTNTLVLGFLIKKYFPEILLIAGGIHPNTLPESTLREMSFIDFIILGEGENTFIEILQCLRNQDRSKIENILGICFLKSGNFIKNQPRPLIPDLNILPMPAWHKIPISNYDVSQPSLRYKRQQGKALTISSSRGCPYQCIFCASHGVLGNSYRYRSFYKVVDELEFLVNKFNVRYFFFVDEVLFQNREHVLGLANEIIKRGLDIQWAGSSRVNAPGIDEAVLKTVLKAGCVRIDFGVESGSSKILKEIRKNISIDEIKNAHKKTHECGLATTTLMMVGHPSESLDDVRDSIRLIAFIDSEYPEFGPATPFPGTALHDIAKKNGWIRSYYWSDYIIGYWYQVMRNQHFDYDEIQDLSFFCNSIASIFSSFVQYKKNVAKPSFSFIPEIILLFKIALKDRLNLIKRNFSTNKRLQLMEMFLVKDRSLEQFEKLLKSISIEDLYKPKIMWFESLKAFDNFIGPKKNKILFIFKCNIGDSLGYLNKMIDFFPNKQIDVVVDNQFGDINAYLGNSKKKVKTIEVMFTDVVDIIHKYNKDYDVIIVPQYYTRAIEYLKMSLWILLCKLTKKPVFILAYGRLIPASIKFFIQTAWVTILNLLHIIFIDVFIIIFNIIPLIRLFRLQLSKK